MVSHRETELVVHVQNLISEGYYLALLTDRIECATYDKLVNLDCAKLLDLRVFNEDYEIRAVRGTLGKDFQIRDSRGYSKLLDDAHWDEARFEDHYLDISGQPKSGESPQDGFIYAATGGGVYRLPQDNLEKIRIETLYQEDTETGTYQPFDFRIVGFLPQD
jgi:hypothetical protein